MISRFHSERASAAVPESAAGFILAGGQSSRMGLDKALALFGGRPLIATAVDLLTASGLSAHIAGSRSPLAFYAPEIHDTWDASGSSLGPLAGVHAALSTTQAQWNVFVTVDSPLLPPSLLTGLLRRAILTQAPITVASLNGRLEPFPAVVHRSSLPIIEQSLASGQRACRLAWEAVSISQNKRLQPLMIENLMQTGELSHPAFLPPVLWFRGANTPRELIWLNQIHRSTSRP